MRLHCARLKESVPFDDICLELSDERGLIEVARKIEPVEEKSTPDKNRALVLNILKQHTNGLPKKMLTNMMKGKNEAKFAVLAELALSNITVESHNQESGRKALWVMLKPGIAL